MTQVFSFGVTVVLVRLLEPSDFGVVALSSVVVGFIVLFGDLAIGSAIIQRDDIDEAYLSTSFWAGIITGCVLCLLMVSFAPFVAIFYDTPILKQILWVSSLGFILGPITSVQMTMFKKRMEFNKLAFIEILRASISGITAVSLAFFGWGIWSLVLGAIAEKIILMPLVWVMGRWKPKFEFDVQRFKTLFGFSTYLLMFNFFNYFARNADNLIIGKLLGVTALGYYSLAYNLMLKPLQYISRAVGNVLFPAFSSIKNDKSRVRRAYTKVIRSISTITFPMMVGLLMVSREFILTIYGEKWSPAIILLQILSLVGAIQSIGTTVANIFLSQGRSDMMFKWGVFASAIVTSAFFIGAYGWGLIGVAVSYLICAGCLWLLSHEYANRLINLDMSTFLKALLPAVSSSIVMFLILLAYKTYNGMYLQLDTFSLLVSSITIGILGYGFSAIFLFKTPEVEELFNSFKVKFCK